jgi:hypothetical protein
MRTIIHQYIHTYMNVRVCVCVCVRMCTHVCMYVYMYVLVCVCTGNQPMYIQMCAMNIVHAHKHTQKHVNAYTHAH